MGPDQVNLVIALLTGFVAWTVGVAGLTLYLHNKFRSLEVAFYRGLAKHRAELDRELQSHRGRIQRLEIKAYGSSLDPWINPTHFVEE